MCMYVCMYVCMFDCTSSVEIPVSRVYHTTTISARLIRVPSTSLIHQSDRFRVRVTAAVTGGGVGDPSASPDPASELVMDSIVVVENFVESKTFTAEFRNML